MDNSSTNTSNTSSTTTTSCLTPSFLAILTQVDYWAYFYIAPPATLIAVLIHVLFLLAFYPKCRKEQPYAYQLFLIVIETLEIATFFLYVISAQWCSAVWSPFTSACSRNFYFVWYGNHLSFQILNGITTTRLLLSLGASIDRLFALIKPFAYKSIRHRWHQAFALVICSTIGLGTSIFDCFHYNVEYNNRTEIYQGVTDQEFVNGRVAQAMNQIRNATRGVGLGLLLLCNFLIIYSFRKQLDKVSAMRANNDGKEIQRRKKEKTLVLLTTSQSILISVDITFYIVYHFIKFVAPDFARCKGLMTGPMLDIALQVTSTINLFVVVAISQPVRRMVMEAVPFCGCTKKQHLVDGLETVFVKAQTPVASD